MEERYPGVVFSQFTGAEMMAEKYGLTKDELDASPSTATARPRGDRGGALRRGNRAGAGRQ